MGNKTYRAICAQDNLLVAGVFDFAVFSFGFAVAGTTADPFPFTSVSAVQVDEVAGGAGAEVEGAPQPGADATAGTALAPVPHPPSGAALPHESPSGNLTVASAPFTGAASAATVEISVQELPGVVAETEGLTT